MHPNYQLRLQNRSTNFITKGNTWPVSITDSCQPQIALPTLVKFIYSEKATKFCDIVPLLLIGTTLDKSKGKISQNFLASEYMNFMQADFMLFAFIKINLKKFNTFLLKSNSI